MTAKKHRFARLLEGLPVVDATNPLTLHITPADVKGAKKKDPAHCAAAKAGQRELRRDVRVFLSRTYVKEKDHWTRYLTPESISREIVSFDRGSDFDPGDYKLLIPTVSQQLGQARGVSTHPEPRTKLKPGRHVTGLIREHGRYNQTRKGKGK